MAWLKKVKEILIKKVKLKKILLANTK